MDGRKNSIYVVIDQLIKCAHFISKDVADTNKVSQVVELFMQDIYRLHGLQKDIVSEQDPIFMGNFWKELLKHVGTTLTPCTSYNPQTYGQLEVVNKYLEG